MNPQETARSLTLSERPKRGGEMCACALFGRSETCACTWLVLVSDVVLKRIGDCH